MKLDKEEEEGMALWAPGLKLSGKQEMKTRGGRCLACLKSRNGHMWGNKGQEQRDTGTRDSRLAGVEMS